MTRYRFTGEYAVEFEAESDEEAMKRGILIDWRIGIIADSDRSELVNSANDLEEVRATTRRIKLGDGTVYHAPYSKRVRSVGFDTELMETTWAELSAKIKPIRR